MNGGVFIGIYGGVTGSNPQMVDLPLIKALNCRKIRPTSTLNTPASEILNPEIFLWLLPLV